MRGIRNWAEMGRKYPAQRISGRPQHTCFFLLNGTARALRPNHVASALATQNNAGITIRDDQIDKRGMINTTGKKIGDASALGSEAAWSLKAETGGAEPKIQTEEGGRGVLIEEEAEDMRSQILCPTPRIDFV